MHTLTLIIGPVWVLIACLSGCTVPAETLSLGVVGTTPEEGGRLPANEVLKVTFDDYLDPESIRQTEVVVKSGAETATLNLGYDPVDRALLIIPRVGLRAGIGYEAFVSAEHLRSLSGNPLGDDIRWTFRAEGPRSQPEYQAIDFETDIRPIFDMSCGCHGPEPKMFPELRPDALIRTSSARQPDRKLIVPGQPLESYLVQRLLPDYPAVQGPPKNLTDSETRRIIRWIREMSGTR